MSQAQGMHFLQHKFQMTVFALMTHLNPTCTVVNQRDTLFIQYGTCLLGDGGATLSSAMDRGLFSHTLSFNKRSNSGGSDPVNMETMHCLLINQLGNRWSSHSLVVTTQQDSFEFSEHPYILVHTANGEVYDQCT